LSGSFATVLYWLIILLLAGVGYWLQSSPKAEIAARRRLRDWRKTTGMVTSSRLEETRAARLSVPDRLLKIRSDIYKPVISYTYLVGDKTYTCSKYKNSFVARAEEWFSTDRQAVEKIVSAHPPGQTVIITYDPDDPATAYLELDSSISRLFIFRTSGIVLILAAALMFMRSAYSTSGDMLTGRPNPEIVAVLPIPSAEIRSALSNNLGLICQYNGIYRQTYESWLCKNPPGSGPATVFVYSRKQALEKTDYLIAKANQPDASAFFTSLLKLVLPQSDLLQLQDWITKSASSLSQTGDRAETTIDNLTFVLSIPSKNILQLDIGKFTQ
jgi:hypothetical protein